MRFANVLSLFGGLLEDIVRHPARIPRYLRPAGAAVMDRRFQEASPIQPLAENLRSQLGRREIVLPPPTTIAHGNQSINGLVFLASLAQSLGARQVFEIGTYNGLTAWCLARNLPEATVHTLDLPHANDAHLPLIETDEHNRQARLVLAYQNLAGGDRVVQHWGDSALFDFRRFHGRCDLVYVDGAHSKEYVLADTRTALELLSPNGAIVWDDYWWRVPTVKEALDGMGELRLYRIPETRLVVYFAPAAYAALTNA